MQHVRRTPAEKRVVFNQSHGTNTAPGFDSYTLRSLYVIRWRTPTLPDVSHVERDVATFKATRPKKTIFGLAIIGADTTPPDSETRTAMGKSMSLLLESLETMHVVIEGQGFRHSILRSAMAGVILIGGKRGRVVIHRSVEEALPGLATELELPLPQLAGDLDRLRLHAS